jgi:uncharacterized membrane protein
MDAESSDPLISTQFSAGGGEGSAGGEKECPHCGAMIAPYAAYCPACGSPMAPLAVEKRAIAAAAYLTWAAGVVLLLLPAFRTQKFIRFHAWQSVLLWGVFTVLAVIGVLLSNVASAMVLLLVGILATLGMLFLWVVLTIKAWQGERFELPLFGEIAGRISG